MARLRVHPRGNPARNSASKQRTAAAQAPGRLLSRGPATFNTRIRFSSSQSRNAAGPIPSSSATTRQGLPTWRAWSAVKAVPPSGAPWFGISVPSASALPPPGFLARPVTPRDCS